MQAQMMKTGVAVALLAVSGCAAATRLPAGDGDHVTLEQPFEAESMVSAARMDLRNDAFTPAQIALLTAAVSRANVITADTTFRAVLAEMEAAREIKWGRRKWRLLPSGARSAPTQWMLDRFTAEGNYRLADIGVGDFSYPPTTAKTTACVPHSTSCALRTTLAPGYVAEGSGQSVNVLANTLVHERVHSFGQIHGWRQTRKANFCDAAYIMGDLAEALLAHRDQGTATTPRQRLCTDLHRRLSARQIVTG